MTGPHDWCVYVVIMVVVTVSPSLINGLCRQQKYNFEYVSHLAVHRQRYATIRPWTFVGNLSDTTGRLFAMRIHNDSSVGPDVAINMTIDDDVILIRNGSRLIVNTTVEDSEGYYIFCMVYDGSAQETCQQCQFVEAQWLLPWTLRDFTVISQKRSQTWIELEFSKVWDLPFPIFVETTAYKVESRDSEQAMRAGEMASRRTIDLVKTYNFVNLTGLRPGQLYVITANMTFNLSLSDRLHRAVTQWQLAEWTRKRFYTATLPDYDAADKRPDRIPPNTATAPLSYCVANHLLPLLIVLVIIRQ